MSAANLCGAGYLHSTLLTAELSSSFSHPPHSTRPPPFTRHCAALHSSLLRPSSVTPPHRQLLLVELQPVQLSEHRYPVSYRGPAVAIREVKLLTNPSTERRTATGNHLLVEQNFKRSPSHSTPVKLLLRQMRIEQPAAPKRYVLEHLHPQAQQIVTHLLPIEL
jgi:hypothetical protein